MARAVRSPPDADRRRTRPRRARRPARAAGPDVPRHRDPDRSRGGVRPMRLTRILPTTVLAACIGLLTAPPTASAAPPRAAASTHAVAISGYAFAPASLTVTAGDTVTWTNADQAPHDVTTTSAPVAIHGSRMDKGQPWSYVFTTPGTYASLCSFHPDMRATVIVKPAATSKAAPPPAPAPRTTTHAAVARPAGGMPMPVRHPSKSR